MKFSNREWKFQARMKISCVGECFFHAFEREWNFSIPGPSGIGPLTAGLGVLVACFAERFRIAKVLSQYRLSPGCALDTRIAASRCHTNRRVKLSSFRHCQDWFLTTDRKKWGTKTGLCFARLCFWRFAGCWQRTIRFRIRIAAASHDTMPLSWGLVTQRFCAHQFYRHLDFSVLLCFFSAGTPANRRGDQMLVCEFWMVTTLFREVLVE